jgi:hypothetical protein
MGPSKKSSCVPLRQTTGYHGHDTPPFIPTENNAVFTRTINANILTGRFKRMSQNLQVNGDSGDVIF